MVSEVYVALFVCFTTKTIHLEIVTDLKFESFIVTLKKLFSRSIMTDNGPTFVGAKTELKRLHPLIKKPDEILANYLTAESVNIKFIPARSLNLWISGLGEAGVKMFKHHLKRILYNFRVTLEEFLSIVTQIEGILNSRPLHYLSSDPNDIEILTPAYFGIGRLIISLPEPDITQIQENRLSILQKVTKMTQHFGKDCSTMDYLVDLNSEQNGSWKNIILKLDVW